MYITVQPPYNEVLGLTNYLFLTPLTLEYNAQYEKKPRYKLTSLVITKIFCQSLGPLLYPGCTVSPRPSPAQALFNMCHENIGKRNCCLCAHCNTMCL